MKKIYQKPMAEESKFFSLSALMETSNPNAGIDDGSDPIDPGTIESKENGSFWDDED